MRLWRAWNCLWPFMAALAVVIDRRVFLMIGAGYIIALFFGLPEGPFSTPAFAPISGLGLGLVVPGAQWQFVRCWMMRALPEFPGMNRLPLRDSTGAAERPAVNPAEVRG